MAAWSGDLPTSRGASYLCIAAGHRPPSGDFSRDIGALADMTGLATELDEVISQAVTGLREAGYSWTEIATRLGITRQAAQQGWARS